VPRLTRPGGGGGVKRRQEREGGRGKGSEEEGKEGGWEGEEKGGWERKEWELTIGLLFFTNFYGLHHQNPPISMLQNALKLTYGHPVKSKF